MMRRTMFTYSRLTINEAQDHRDPSDHVIIAHAITECLTLLSSDQKFAFYRSQGLDLLEYYPPNFLTTDLTDLSDLCLPLCRKRTGKRLPVSITDLDTHRTVMTRNSVCTRFLSPRSYKVELL